MESLVQLLKTIPPRGWAGTLAAGGLLVLLLGATVEALAIIGLVMMLTGIGWLIFTSRPSASKRRTAIPLSMQRQIWKRAHDRCEIPRCQTKGRLEFHHIDNNPSHHEPDNLIHLCHDHHNLATRGRYTRDELRDYISDSKQRERRRRRGAVAR